MTGSAKKRPGHCCDALGITNSCVGIMKIIAKNAEQYAEEECDGPKHCLKGYCFSMKSCIESLKDKLDLNVKNAIVLEIEDKLNHMIAWLDDIVSYEKDIHFQEKKTEMEGGLLQLCLFLECLFGIAIQPNVMKIETTVNQFKSIARPQVWMSTTEKSKIHKSLAKSRARARTNLEFDNEESLRHKS